MILVLYGLQIQGDVPRWIQDFCSPLLPEFIVDEAARPGLGSSVLGVPRAERKPLSLLVASGQVVRNTRGCIVYLASPLKSLGGKI